MPTGYTAGVQDGTITEFSDFAMQCARAFGAHIDMRDEPVDAKIRPAESDGYYEKRVAELESELESMASLPGTTWHARSEKAYNDAVAAWEETRARREAERERYERMLEKAHAYTPPTPAHEGLAKFMVEQLEESIRHDCGMEYYPMPERKPADVFCKEELDRVGQGLARARQSLAQEADRVASRNAWVQALRDSLSN